MTKSKFFKMVDKLLRFRIFLFRRVFSNVRLRGNFTIASPTLFLSYNAGQIGIGNGVQFGYFPSPYFFSGYNHLEARGGGHFYL